MKIIDPHLHLFNIELGDYHWLKADNPPFWSDKHRINKNFDETNLTLTAPLLLSGFIHIEAGFDNQKPWHELVTLEKNCNKPFKSIANIDLTVSSEHVNIVLDKLAEHPSFVGVRHLMDDQALTLLKSQQVIDNIKILNKKGLVFEVQLPLIDQATIDALCEVITNNRNINFIINHAGFPPKDTDTIEWQHWQSNLTILALYPHVAIKCSGWEMTDRHYQTTWLNQNLSLIFTIFEAKKIMLASNFPLCLFSHNSYQAYWQSIISSEFFQERTEQEKSALCYDNALNWYSMSDIIN
jgi:predicted TIM-barrel fold metal-dependent hydrolase